MPRGTLPDSFSQPEFTVLYTRRPSVRRPWQSRVQSERDPADHKQFSSASEAPKVAHSDFRADTGWGMIVAATGGAAISCGRANDSYTSSQRPTAELNATNLAARFYPFAAVSSPKYPRIRRT